MKKFNPVQYFIFQSIFKIDLMQFTDYLQQAITGNWVFNVEKFDRMLHRLNENESLSEYINANFGSEARRLIIDLSQGNFDVTNYDTKAHKHFAIIH